MFLLPRVILRARVERWVSFGQLLGRIFCVFFCPDHFFGLLEFAVLIFRIAHLQDPTFVPAAPPDHQLGGK